MLEFIKGVLDNWAKWKDRGRTSRSELLTAFFIIQTQHWSGRPGHRFPGVRERQNTPEGVYFFRVLWGHVRQSYFPIIRGVWIMLWEVLIRSYSWGLSPRGLKRPVSGYRGVILLWGKWHVSRSWFMFALVRVFFGSRRRDPRFIGILIWLVRGRARVNWLLMALLFVRVRDLFGMTFRGGNVLIRGNLSRY